MSEDEDRKIGQTDEDRTDDVEAHVKARGANDEGAADDGDDDVEAHVKQGKN